MGPVKPELLIGEWNGGTFDTGHAGVARMADMKWAGKTFRGVDDGIPIMVIDGDGNRVQDKEWGGSSVSSSDRNAVRRLVGIRRLIA